ncbi:uncharacterized protein [Lolium perenne]|uniref:uncharacterized protein n=1 Tax=Lolium perenne TaxID=4522 RepID=UPI0021F66F45|nr:uncharacterized protein LOC127326823 [Lolium perenne]
MSDHYRTLGLQPNASKSDIKSAYFRLALSYHPDHHAKADAAGRAAAAVWFRRVKDAYEVLYDDRRRAEYDRTIRAGGGYGNRQHGGPSPRSSGGGTSYSKESEPEWILKRARARGHGGGAYSSSSGNGNRQGQQHGAGAGASSKSSGGGPSSTTESDSEWMWERARTRCHGDGAYSSSTVHGNRQSQSGGTSSSSSTGGGTSSSSGPALRRCNRCDRTGPLIARGPRSLCILVRILVPISGGAAHVCKFGKKKNRINQLTCLYAPRTHQ